MRVPEDIIFTSFTVGNYEIFIFQDPEGELITLKTYKYGE
jgi:hypothetical protein|tara:strand:+ start:143 stop:262 length:120 start_codon:yes stop_codon:yes gene_type:complete